MSSQSIDKENGNLREVNKELRESLTRCRELLDDCRTKLTANSNDADRSEWEETGSEAGTERQSSQARK